MRDCTVMAGTGQKMADCHEAAVRMSSLWNSSQIINGRSDINRISQTTNDEVSLMKAPKNVSCLPIRAKVTGLLIIPFLFFATGPVIAATTIEELTPILIAAESTPKKVNAVKQKVIPVQGKKILTPSKGSLQNAVVDAGKCPPINTGGSNGDYVGGKCLYPLSEGCPTDTGRNCEPIDTKCRCDKKDVLGGTGGIGTPARTQGSGQ